MTASTAVCDESWPQMYHGRAAADPLMGDGPRAALSKLVCRIRRGAMRVLIAGDRGSVRVSAVLFRRAAGRGADGI